MIKYRISINYKINGMIVADLNIGGKLELSINNFNPVPVIPAPALL
jgi:hypothetical protein